MDHDINDLYRRCFQAGMTRHRYVCVECGRFFLTLSGANRHADGKGHPVIHHSGLQNNDLVGKSFMGAHFS